METQTYNVQEASANLLSLLRAVAPDVIISDKGKPIARLSRVEETPPKIRFGVLRGKIKVSDDFDAPFPDRILTEFEGTECSS